MMFADKLENFNRDVNTFMKLNEAAEELLTTFYNFCTTPLENVDLGKQPFIRSISNIRKLSKNELEFEFFGESYRFRYDVYPKFWLIIFQTYRSETDPTNYLNKKWVLMEPLSMKGDGLKNINKIFDNSSLEHGSIDRNYIELLYDNYCLRMEEVKKKR